MKSEPQFFILLLLVSISPLIIAHPSTQCNRSCGGGPAGRVQFPFGFSDGCDIRLNCSQNGTVLLHELPVQTVGPEIIQVSLPAQCDRPVETLRELFGRNYAPTSHNGILLQNCSSPLASCLIPTTMVQTHFELQDCGTKTNNMSCYSEQNNRSMFINYKNLKNSGCRSLFSAISVESVSNSSAISLDVQVVQLGWWLEGSTCRCSPNTNCTRVWPYDRAPGYRCRCLEGFVGDGYQAGSGCRKEPTGCNLQRYLSGQCGRTTRVVVLVGGVGAGASFMVSVGLICCFIRRRTRLKTHNRTKRQLCEATGITIPIYPYREIEKATVFFSEQRRLGTGAYGTVYSGKLHNDEWVAIKRIKNRDIDSVEQVVNEIKLLSSVSHPNLVRLLGCSIEKGDQILVYEFMPNGTLSQHLQGEKGKNGLPWPVRLTIATETAQAVAYLHNAMHPPIYHRDIKSSNILLDYNYKSKVADFGLSRLGMIESSHISTAPQGTPGYLDPQYHQNFQLSDKSDVYSFGVVLVEIITALKVVDFSRPHDEVNLAALAVERIGRGCFDEIIDPSLDANGDPWTSSSIHKVAELAFRCLAFHRDMRPSMMEVAIELEQIRLSRWLGCTEENAGKSTETFSSTSLSSSSFSNVSENPLGFVVKKAEMGNNKGVFGTEMANDYSPVSVQEYWPSEQSSPSSSSLLGHAIQ